MIQNGAQHVSLSREPGSATSRILLTIEGKRL
ncbi:hypothetical protein J2W32_005943 [Variovorax boronicumulans]|uniref:Uncharacterized protein n=1 Tax=Variovorax boronicumulans TaxID=436515 RepID=A0AAW8D710_9BURK|nr:hypothetical protein [Variovorax boronicumulans]MDP9993894.1 hypothetical protein [Variovorax boronicumulans]MDQ0005243.1 hypothetical protein [Variovorax boronicumulans]MDQ0056869.1 hypothetical protein [Variovorax boronicumulans]